VTSSATLRVDFDGRVTNNGNAVLTNVNVQEAVITGGITPVYRGNLPLNLFACSARDNTTHACNAWTAKGSCTSCTLSPDDYVTATGNYTPTSADLTTFSGLAAFSDRFKVTATEPEFNPPGTITNTDATATCTIALGTACPTP